MSKGTSTRTTPMLPIHTPTTSRLRRDRLLRRIQWACVALAVIGAVILIVSWAAASDCVSENTRTGHGCPVVAAALKTPWGEPDLQGIWTVETDTLLQRPAKYANQEFF